MSLISVIKWQPSNGNLATIAPVQALAAAGALFINSTPNNQGANPFTESGTILILNGGPYYYDNVARTVSLTSTANLSARTITITGQGIAPNGGIPINPLNTPISENIAGPNANTIDSVNYYTRIDSITIDGVAANISAGFGTAGITNPITMDYDRTGWYASCSGQVIDNVSLTYGGYVSLNKLSFPSTVGNLLSFNQVYGTGIPGFLITTTATESTNQLVQINSPVALVWFHIVANDYNNVNESAIFTLVQQGIK